MIEQLAILLLGQHDHRSLKDQPDFRGCRSSVIRKPRAGASVRDLVDQCRTIVADPRLVDPPARRRELITLVGGRLRRNVRRGTVGCRLPRQRKPTTRIEKPTRSGIARPPAKTSFSASGADMAWPHPVSVQQCPQTNYTNVWRRHPHGRLTTARVTHVLEHRSNVSAAHYPRIDHVRNAFVPNLTQCSGHISNGGHCGSALCLRRHHSRSAGQVHAESAGWTGVL